MIIRDKHTCIRHVCVFSLDALADDRNTPEREGCPLRGGGSGHRAAAPLWGGAVARSPRSTSTWELHAPAAREAQVLGSKTTTKSRLF